MLLSIEPGPARVALRAMKMVADANGTVADRESALMSAVANALGIALDAEPLAPVTPDDVARAFPDPLWRRRVVQAMVATSMIDGEVIAGEHRIIERFATALDIDDPWVRNLERVVEGDLLRLRVDIVRRMPFARQLVKEMWDEKGIRGLYHLFNVVRSKGNPDPELAWRYKQLGLLSENTLGRHFWVHMTERKLPFPGEPGGFLEELVQHDLTHVLTGYDTDPAGEAQVAAFNAGFKHEDPFAPLFMVLTMFQLGLHTLPVVQPAKLQIDPDALVRAMARGAAANQDPTEKGWDYWPLMPLPLDEARARLGISPS